MQNQVIDITTLSEAELKSLAYDYIVQRDNANTNLDMIQSELNARVNKANDDLIAAMKAAEPPIASESTDDKKEVKAPKKPAKKPGSK